MDKENKMSSYNFEDLAVDRKLTFKIAQMGCAIDRDRYVCYCSIGDIEKGSDEFATLLIELAKMHYEADFIVGTSADENNTHKEDKDDNLYMVSELSEELDEFLKFNAQVTITQEEFNTDGADALRKRVIDSMKREGFKRDETTKRAYFKINKSINNNKK